MTACVEDAMENNIARSEMDDLWLYTFAAWPSFV
jgi:hypothetical protein